MPDGNTTSAMTKLHKLRKEIYNNALTGWTLYLMAFLENGVTYLYFCYTLVPFCIINCLLQATADKQSNGIQTISVWLLETAL